MKKTILGVFVVVFTMLICFTLKMDLQAQEQDDEPIQPDLAGMELSRLFDTNRDGFVSRDEWSQAFSDRDKDSDGQLSLEELRMSPGRTSEEELGPDYGRLAAFERLDANMSDFIDTTEWPGRAVDFRYIDSDRDGTLSRREFLSSKGRWWNQKFENLDFNADGIISQAEWLDSSSAFDRIDRNKNGVLEKREFYNSR